MENWKYNDKYIQAYKLKIEDIKELNSIIHKPINQRKNFYINNNDIIIPRIFLSLVGIKDVENQYYDNLLKLKNELLEYKELFLFFENEIKLEANNDIKIRFENTWQKIKLFYDIQAKRVVELLYENGLFPIIPNDALLKQLQDNLEGIIDYYFEISNDSIEEEDFKNILFSVIKFTNQYIPSLVKDYDYININPKVFYYGDIKKTDAYILIYLSSLGVDIIYVNPYSDNALINADPYFQFVQRIENNRKLFPKPFPVAMSIGAIETPTLLAQNEIRQLLYNEQTGLYAQGQLTNLTVNCVHLKTTYDEIYIVGKEAPALRHGFKQDDKMTIIPTIFAKIMGVETNKKEFNNKISELLQNENSTIYLPTQQFGFKNQEYMEKIISDFSNRCKIDANWFYNTDKLMLSECWGNFKSLPYNTQKILAEKMCLIVNKKIIKLESSLDFTLNAFPKEELALFSLMLLLGESEWLINFLKNYDLSNNSPTIISVSKRSLNWLEILLFLLLNLMGTDVIIINTTCSADIENYILPQLFDVHYLENNSEEYSYKKKFFGTENIINKI